jgi:WD repeat-containing protein 70
MEDDDYDVENPMGDDSLMAMMPMSFGKQDKKKDIGALSAGFARTKRAVCQLKDSLTLQVETNQPKPKTTQPKLLAEISDGDSSDDVIGPMPAEAGDSEEVDFSDDDDEDDEFPVSHEIVLKDHTKVCQG